MIAKLEAAPPLDVKGVPDRAYSHARLRPLLALMSFTAILCSSLEIEILQQVDSLRLYLTPREIAGDTAIAFLILLGFTVAWWLFLVFWVWAAKITPWTERHRELILWRFGLGVPLSYFAIDFFLSVRMQLFPRWHPGPIGWLWLITAVAFICVGFVGTLSLPRLQNICATRLGPVGLIHIVVLAGVFIALALHGLHRFHDHTNVGRGGNSKLPDIYLITVDTLRADETSVYGYSRRTTPNLDRLAQQAFTFEFFFANSNFTTTSTTSIETGKLPWTHRVFQLGGFLRGQNQRENLAEVLRHQGYYTASISANGMASPFQHRSLQSYDAAQLALPRNASGIWSKYTDFTGFDSAYTLSGALLKFLSGARQYMDAVFWSKEYADPAEEVFGRARTLLERSQMTRPHFLWTHIMPPHHPYLAPPPFQKRYLASNKLTRNYEYIGLGNSSLPPGASVADLRDRYDESIAYADHAVGDFLDWLQQTGRFDHSIVIVTSDHGESFENHWFLHTGPYLSDGLIRVPLLIHLPGQRQGERVYESAEQADLLPTIVDIVGGQIPKWADGTSLKPALEQGNLPARTIFSMNLERNSSFGPIKHGTVAVIDGEFKYIERLETQQASVFRYKSDLHEEHDLIDSEAAIGKAAHVALMRKLDEINARARFKP